MHKIYRPGILEGTVDLSGDESKHLVRVMRMQEGQEVLLLDGCGGKAKATLVDAHPKRSKVRIDQFTHGELPFKKPLTIAIAPTKNIDRFEYFLEKATELGIHRIVPLLCERSERKVIKDDRLNKILISGMKQSGQIYLPQLDPLTPVRDFVENNPGGLIAFCEDREKSPSLEAAMDDQKNLTILIGPEGDFSPSEIKFALDHNYKTISMGESVLRTETAGILACSTARNYEMAHQ